MSTLSTPTPTLGDVLVVDDRTVLVIGQELDVAHEQPDVANALLHRVGTTLVLVDTGVTLAFRAALRRAAHMVGAWDRLVVLTTHGHPDHVGNDDLADELAAERGVPVEHHVPAGDMAQMADPDSYWVASFRRIAGVVPLPAPPQLAGNKVVSLFAPLRPFGATTRPYEDRPFERLTLGSVRATGWSFADGAVRVLRSQGHCAGHVMVLVRDAGLLHLGDEANGPCGVMHDADQLKVQTALGTAATLLAEGTVTVLTDGHTPTIRRGPEATAFIENLLDQAAALSQVALDAVGGSAEVDLRAFAAEYGKGVARLEVGGANPNAMFTGMMAVNALKELGLRPAGRSGWRRPRAGNPAPVAGMPRGLALVPAAVAMLRWKLRGGDR